MSNHTERRAAESDAAQRAAIITCFEDAFLGPMAQCLPVPMTEDQTETMVICCTTPNDTMKVMYEHVLAKSLAVQVISLRTSLFCRPVTEGAQIMLSAMVTTPREAVMLLTYLMWQAKRRGEQEVDIRAFADLFARGFPAHADMTRLWDAQKGAGFGMDNLVDSGVVVDWLNEGCWQAERYGQAEGSAA